MTIQQVLTREEKITIITKRDGPDCFLCETPFKPRDEITLDHWLPRAHGGSDDVENLRLAHKRCNALKADRIPNADGTLPEFETKDKFRSRAMKRAARPDLCQRCDNGRSLGPQESCNVCHSGPMPERWPRWAKADKASECDHADFWCWACGTGIVQRKPVVNDLLGM